MVYTKRNLGGSCILMQYGMDKYPKGNFNAPRFVNPNYNTTRDKYRSVHGERHIKCVTPYSAQYIHIFTKLLF